MPREECVKEMWENRGNRSKIVIRIFYGNFLVADDEEKSENRIENDRRQGW